MKKGFTLIEVLVAMTIVAIIAALTYPALTDYTRRSRRAEGIRALITMATEMEKQYIIANTYPSDASIQDNSVTNPFKLIRDSTTLYTLSRTDSAARQFVIQAKAVAGSSQASDSEGTTDCSTLTLTNVGVKSPADCWR
jgi:type IV pilus assembly protein PilE